MAVRGVRRVTSPQCRVLANRFGRAAGQNPERTAAELIQVIDEEIARLSVEPPAKDELERTIARTELALYAGLETAEGKASSIGFYAAVLDRPAAAFEKLEQLRSVTRSDLLRVARRYLVPSSRTVVTTVPRADGVDS